MGLTSYFEQNPSTVRHRFPDPSPTFPFPSADPCPLTNDDESETIQTISTRSTDSSATSFEFPDSDDDDSSTESTSHDSILSNVTFSFSDNPYVHLRQAQDAIGWDHFLRGKISRMWSDLQYQHAIRHNLIDASKQWESCLNNFMMNSSHQMWLLRNKGRHGHDHQTQRAKVLEQAHRDVTRLYELKDQVLQQDRDLFCASLELHLTQPLSQLRNWLSLNKTMILQSVRSAITGSQAKSTRLPHFFPRTPRPPRNSQRRPTKTPPEDPTYRPSRVTQFFSMLPRPSKRLPTIREAKAPTPPSAPPNSCPAPRPRQRYLFDFFPNHPG